MHFTPLFTSLYCLTFILLLCLPHCIVWHSIYWSVYSFYCSVCSFYRSVYPIVLSDIHFTALFTSLYCLTFILLLCSSHCIVWHSSYCSVYLIVLSDIHFTALFTPLYCLTFTLLLCLPHCFVWHFKMNKHSSEVNIRQYNEVNRAVKWMSDTTMG
jgi:hypothetical protein